VYDVVLHPYIKNAMDASILAPAEYPKNLSCRT